MNQSATFFGRLAEAAKRRLQAIGRSSFSLTTKMFILVLIAVMPALAIQSYNEYDLRKSREDEIRNKTIQVTRQFGAEMGEIREGARQYLQVLSQLPPVNSLDSEACARLLATLNANTPYYSLLGVADSTGRIRCTSRPTGLTSIADMSFFKRALAQPDLAVGTYWVDPINGEKQIHFALEFSAVKGGPAVGVVFAGLNLAWLSEHLKERGLTPTQSILIADREGNIIARLPSPEKLVGKNMRSGHAEIMDGNTAGWEEAKGVDGLVRIFGYVPPALPPRDFFLSAGESKAAAFAAIDQVTRRGILLILAGLLLAGYAAWMGGRIFIQRPIRALLNVTTEWRNGNYAARCQLKGTRTEIDQLGAAFNEMAEAVAFRHSAQVQAEDRLQALNVTLEDRVEERTRELVAANRAKAQFLANMSHELRTPMTAILGYSELLNTGDLSPTEQHEFLDSIQHSGKSLIGIIDDILDLARIEADQLPMQKMDCSVQQIVEEVMAVARIAAAKKGLNLRVAYSLPVPATIGTDASRLRQILVNLVGNAVKFTEQGEVSLTVRSSESAERTARWQFVVSDTGIGIPTDKLAEVFQPFFQVDSSHTRLYGGTGLGLAICQRLTKSLDGRLEVASELGRGSTFTLTIDGGPWRLTQGDDGAASNTAVATTSQAEQQDERSPALQGRILLVEDEPSLQVVIRHMLRTLNVEVELAGDGRLACQMVEQSRAEGRPYALILMDIQLPQMNGLEATRRLRTQGWSGPIVALTAYAMVGDRERCLAAGCDDYLPKPISPSRLREVLRRYLG